jgi:hypothetical protein
MRSLLGSFSLALVLAAGASAALAAPPKNVTKQWSASERGNQALHSAPTYVALKGRALADYRALKRSGSSPEVIRLKTRSAVAKTTFALRSQTDELTSYGIYNRRTQQPIAYGWEGGVAARIYWRAP